MISRIEALLWGAVPTMLVRPRLEAAKMASIQERSVTITEGGVR